MDDSHVIGYYTVSMAQFEFTTLPDTLKHQLPKYPIPAVRVGKLAINSKCQGKGYGTLLLMDALTRCIRAAEEIAIYAVIVDAIDQQAKNFYQKFGFIPFKDHTLSLLLPISTISQAISC